MTTCELVTVGETMGLFGADEIGPLSCGRRMIFGLAGAESNVAIGVRRLGHTTRWIGRVGDDPVGRCVLRELRAEDVAIDGVTVDEDAPTGLMVKVRRSSSMSTVLYARTGSAGSRLSPTDVRPELISGARALHVTGITPALSASARACVERAIDLARESGALVSLDVNHRSLLWSAESGAPVVRQLAARSDIVFASEPEAEMLVGAAPAEETVTRLAELTGGAAVLKRGEHGCLAFLDGELRCHPAFEVPVVDPVGAGDAFVAGYLAAFLDGKPVQERLRIANLAGAHVVSVPGDWEGLPTQADIEAFERRVDAVER